ncbi:hypothetical protein GCM10027052_28750 [Parafrigoribacterium mesophilum]|uniref:type IV toxin-antitoxin system AbiEi family antitoxin n=1 Tax=Parafrigoribacterium mesophilum TaxID=433646 RepID=UPI0031FE32D4
MPYRLPAVLSRVDLPEAELCAALLDGELYRVDECFSPCDEVERPITRANALAAITPSRLIAEQRTAAWVHGALGVPPTVHQFCVDARARARPPRTRRISVREVEIDGSEVQSFGGVRVTTPLRTVADLARFSPAFGCEERLIVTALLAIDGFGIDECRLALNRRHNLPGKRRALRRIAASLEAAGLSRR